MARSTNILVAAHALTGGTGVKDTEKHKVRAGTELTADLIKKLGLTDDTVKQLIGTGAIVEQSARSAEPGEDVATLEAHLATQTKRADDAEAKVKDLEVQIATLKKSAA